MASYPPELPMSLPCTAIPAKSTSKRLKSLCFFCALGFAPILCWVAEGFNTPRDVEQVPPHPLTPIHCISGLILLAFLLLPSLLEGTFFVTFWLHRGPGLKKVENLLPPICCHMWPLAPIPPNPPAWSMTLFPSPILMKFVVCT